MVDKNVVERILDEAVNAPSGDNAQPWEFTYDGTTLCVYNVSGQDPTLYNYKERGSYLAHGALAENIAVAASAHSLSAGITPFPGAADCTCRITFSKSGAATDPLSESIRARTTNRKPFLARPLSGEDREALQQSIADREYARLQLVEEPGAIGRTAKAIGANEALLFSHRELHGFLFSMIRWSTKEEQEKPGLYVMTMEFPPPLRFLLRHVFAYWPVMRMLAKLGLPSFISSQSTANHAACSAFGAITITGHSDEDYFLAGRALERLWLTATARGLALQPVTAMPYLLERLREGDAHMFTTEQQESIKTAGEAIERECALSEGEHVAMLFRIGYDGEPSAHSAKLPPRFREP